MRGRRAAGALALAAVLVGGGAAAALVLPDDAPGGRYLATPVLDRVNDVFDLLAD